MGFKLSRRCSAIVSVASTYSGCVGDIFKFPQLMCVKAWHGMRLETKATFSLLPLSIEYPLACSTSGCRACLLGNSGMGH